jgi:membrane protein DedA with SNARE-associated domain/rhodanese-related sulfurtransferase
MLQEYGVWAVFISVALEGAGFPVPAIPVVLAAAASAHDSPATVAEILLTAAGATFVTDIAWFGAGRLYGQKVLGTLCRLSISPDSCVTGVDSLFARFGSAFVFFAKFVPALSTVATAVAGSQRMRWRLFLLLDGIGSIAACAIPVTLGYLFHDAVDGMVNGLARFGGWGVCLIIAAFALYLGWKWTKRRAFLKEIRMGRVSVGEVREMIEQGLAPIILDVRVQQQRISGGTIPGAISAGPYEVSQLKGQLPLDAEIVTFCACPNEISAAVAALHLRKAGYRRIRPLLGGIEAWRDAGMPIEELAHS